MVDYVPLGLPRADRSIYLPSQDRAGRAGCGRGGRRRDAVIGFRAEVGSNALVDRGAIVPDDAVVADNSRVRRRP